MWWFMSLSRWAALEAVVCCSVMPHLKTLSQQNLCGQDRIRGGECGRCNQRGWGALWKNGDSLLLLMRQDTGTWSGKDKDLHAVSCTANKCTLQCFNSTFKVHYHNVKQPSPTRDQPTERYWDSSEAVPNIGSTFRLSVESSLLSIHNLA